MKNFSTFRCEVSTDAPDFTTIEESKEMEVFGKMMYKIIVLFNSNQITKNQKWKLKYHL